MRVVRVIASIGIGLLTGCGATPDPVSGGAAGATGAVTEVRVGACAPVRYREIDPDDQKPRPPPKPTVRMSFSVASYYTPAFRSAVTSRLRELEPQLASCHDPSTFASRSQYRTTLRIYQSASGQITRIAVYGGNRPAKSCLQRRLRAQLGSLPRGGSSASIYLTFSVNRQPKPLEPERIELLEGSDRVGASLSLAAAVAAKGEVITRCARSAAPGSGRLAAILRLDKGVVATTEVSDPGEFATCTASALAEVDLKNETIAGVFECALGYGTPGAARPRFATVVGADWIAVAGGTAISEALLREQRPPAGPLYQQLSQRRFAADGGPAMALRIGDDARGALLVLTAEATAAADVSIAAIEAKRGGEWKTIAALSAMPSVQLSKVTAQAAGPVVIIERDALWVGAGRGHHERELPLADIPTLPKLLATLRAAPGLRHRSDILVGVGANSRGSAIAAVIEQIAGAGFDQIELVGAETAKARLAK